MWAFFLPLAVMSVHVHEHAIPRAGSFKLVPSEEVCDTSLISHCPRAPRAWMLNAPTDGGGVRSAAVRAFVVHGGTCSALRVCVILCHMIGVGAPLAFSFFLTLFLVFCPPLLSSVRAPLCYVCQGLCKDGLGSRCATVIDNNGTHEGVDITPNLKILKPVQVRP